MRRSPPPLRVTRPPPSSTTGPLAFATLAVAVMVMVPGAAPQSKVMIPPPATASTTAWEVQLSALPSPITRVGWEVSTAWASAGTSAVPAGLPDVIGGGGASKVRGAAGTAGGNVRVATTSAGTVTAGRAATSSAPPQPAAAASATAAATSAVTRRRVRTRPMPGHRRRSICPSRAAWPRRSGGQVSRLQDPAGVLGSGSNPTVLPGQPSGAGLMPRTLRPGQRAELFVIDAETGESRLVHSSSTLLFEAPNWSSDGKWLVVNGDGKLFRIAAEAGGELEEVHLGGVPPINNDHVLSPDGETVYVSADDGHIYACLLY